MDVALSNTKSSVSKADMERIKKFSDEFGESGSYAIGLEPQPTKVDSVQDSDPKDLNRPAQRPQLIRRNQIQKRP